METATRILFDHNPLVPLNSSSILTSSHASGSSINFNLTNNLTNDSFSGTSAPSFTVEAPSWPTYLPIYVTILNVVLFFTGTVGNVLVIVVVIMVRHMRTPMNWYLVNLSIADLLVLLVCQPAALTEFFARDRWFLGGVLCKLVPFLEHAALHTSTLIILAITVERYYAICRPLKKLAVCHKPRPLRVLPAVWSTAILTSVPFIIMTNLQETYFFDGTPCQVCATSVSEYWHYSYIISMSLCFFALPLLLLLCIYVRIIQSLRSSGTALRVRQVEDVNMLSSHRSRKQVIKMLVGIVVLFFVCLIPVRCVIIWQIFTPDSKIKGLGPEKYYNIMWISRLLMYANSAGNPIIYSLISSNFQQAFWRLLTRGSSSTICQTRQESESTRRGSVSGRSLAGKHRNSMSPHAGSGVRLLALNNSKMGVHRGRGCVTSSLRSECTFSVSTCSSPTYKPTSCLLVKKEVMFSLPYKDRSCTSIL